MSTLYAAVLALGAGAWGWQAVSTYRRRAADLQTAVCAYACLAAWLAATAASWVS